MVTIVNKLQHSIERKAFESILDNVIKQGQDHDVMDSIDSLFSKMEFNESPRVKTRGILP